MEEQSAKQTVTPGTQRQAHGMQRIFSLLGVEEVTFGPLQMERELTSLVAMVIVMAMVQIRDSSRDRGSRQLADRI